MRRAEIDAQDCKIFLGVKRLELRLCGGSVCQVNTDRLRVFNDVVRRQQGPVLTHREASPIGRFRYRPNLWNAGNCVPFRSSFAFFRFLCRRRRDWWLSYGNDAVITSIGDRDAVRTARKPFDGRADELPETESQNIHNAMPNSAPCARLVA